MKEEPDDCVICSEKSMLCFGRKVKRWCLLIVLLVLVTVGFAIPFGLYAFHFGEATACRLTYTEDAIITESEMQGWMAKENWPLSVPTYDPWKRTCVCKGFEDMDPKSLLPTDEVLVWIAPGDLVSLSDETKITPHLPMDFTDKYRTIYGENDHVKVCLPQQLVLDLWNIGTDVADGGRHCHVSAGDASSNVEQFYLGWDGALYCTPSDCPKWNPDWLDPSFGSHNIFTTDDTILSYAYAVNKLDENVPSITNVDFRSKNGNMWCCAFHCINWGQDTLNCVKFIAIHDGSTVSSSDVACDVDG